MDDDAEMLDLLTTWLACDGFTPVRARNGAEALELLVDGFRPDVILLDLMMPVMDGWTFLREQGLRRNLATIPVIVVSAVADPGVQWPAWVTTVIPKPCDFALLFDSIRRVSAVGSRGVGSA